MKHQNATYKSVDCQVASRERIPGVEGDLQQTVGRNLRAYRQAKGLSQEAFADVLGVHRTYMGGIERGERNLTLKSLERIAGRLELDPLTLLASRDEHPAKP
jgi:transcriptional regulator with XRE-family HTH domain